MYDNINNAHKYDSSKSSSHKKIITGPNWNTVTFIDNRQFHGKTFGNNLLLRGHLFLHKEILPIRLHLISHKQIFKNLFKKFIKD